MVASYHRSRLSGLGCSSIVDEGPPRVSVHDRLVLLALTDGEAVVWFRGETHAIGPGALLVIAPGDVHREIQKTPYRAVMMELDADLVRSLCGPMPLGSCVVRSGPLHAEMVELVAAVRRQSNAALQEQRTAGLLRRLAPLSAPGGQRTEPPLVARARRALLESPGSTLSLDDLAARLRCAPTYLCRVFSEHTGVGPHAYQLQQRLLQARQLVESGRTVAAAAALTGFGDESHLRRHFRRRFAVAPGQYQRERTPLP